MKFTDVESVTFEEHRWYIIIHVKLKDGTTKTPTFGAVDSEPILFESVEEYRKSLEW